MKHQDTVSFWLDGQHCIGYMYGFIGISIQKELCIMYAYTYIYLEAVCRNVTKLL